MSDSPAAVPVVPAATILIVRDAPAGLEVFMVKRHHEIDFAAGALVFPGGKAAKGDFDDAIGDHARGLADATGGLRALAACAIREAFEESGILFAYDDTGAVVGGARLARLAPWRERLERGDNALVDMLRAEKLTLACDRLVHYAHWVTPTSMPKRFDTHFFLAAVPDGQVAGHDGRESVDSTWIRPDDAISDPTRFTVVFPTRLNLMKLAKSATIATALAEAAKAPPVTVEPWVESLPDGRRVVRIREDAGYDETRASVHDAPRAAPPKASPG